MDNFEMTIITDDNNGKINMETDDLNGVLKPVSPNEPCQSDAVACDSNQTYWINQRNNSLRWYYRLTHRNANWVYGRSGSDGIACAHCFRITFFCTHYYLLKRTKNSITNSRFTNNAITNKTIK